MRYRVGLDVGTASLGVAAFSLDNSNQPINLVWSHIRIFDEPLEKSQAGLKSKKAGRRAARMQRRQIDRRLGRTKRIASLMSLLGVELEPSPDSGRTLLEIRAKAAREQILLSDLMRIFIKLGKRRGYAGEFRPKKEGAKLGEVEGGNNDLKKQMEALAETQGFTNVTLGEFLYQRWLDGKPTKLKIKESNDKTIQDPNLYALRSQLEAEFEQIWQTQSAFYPVLNSTHQNELLKKTFYDAIFYQRPLKAVGGMVGQCGLEPTLPRAPRAQLAFQHFRIEKTLSDLRWGAGKRAEKLTAAQKAVIRQLCDEKDVVKFEAIYKALETAGCAKPEGHGLNLDRLSRDELPGNKTNAVFRKLGLADEWLALDERTQVQAINFLADLGSPEQLDDPLWHTRFAKVDGSPREMPEAFVAFINKLNENEKFDRLSKMGFEGGRASYSIKALNKFTDWFDTPWWPDGWQGEMRPDEDAAIRVCYPQDEKPKAMLERLDVPPATGNAVVDGSLRQIRYVLNRMIADLGTVPEQMVVEMARDMSVGVSKRNEREKAISDNKDDRKKAAKAIEEKYPEIAVTDRRVKRYQLHQEQGTKCPYCGQTIEFSHAMTGAFSEIDHILPKSLTQIGYKRSEVVLVHSSCNQEKSNRSPWEAWGDGRNEHRWLAIQDAASRLKKVGLNRKAKLLLIEEYDNDVSIDDFTDRQFHQTSWIAKEAVMWLQSICKTLVSVSRGELTAMLRRKWKLETVIPQARIGEGLPILDDEGNVITPEDFERYQKIWEGQGHRAEDKANHTDRKLDKRIDHRHHLIDAITIGLTSRAMFQQMARQYKLDTEREARGQRPRLEVAEPPLHNVRELALKVIKECPLSIKPDRYPDGAIFQDTAYSIAVKDGEDKARLTLRTNLVDLIDRKKGTTEQARKAIQYIVSDIIRKIVSETFEARIAGGRTAPEALIEPIYQKLYGRQLQIKKVSCFTGIYADNVAIIRHVDKNGREHFKRLINGGYSYLEAEIREGRLVGQPNLVKLQQAMRNKKLPKKDGVMRFYKGDSVLDSADGKKYRIGMFKAAAGFFLVPITDPRAYNAIEEPNSGKKSLSFSQVARLKLM